MVARFLGGMGIGISTVVSPLYISEIAPAERRGRLTGLYQFNIVAGILIAFLSNFLIGKYMEPTTAWRWMLGVEAIPALFYVLASFTVPESPRWLISRNKTQQAAEILRRLNPELTEETTSQRITEITSAATVSRSGIQIPFLSKPLLKPISLAFFIALFNQLSGINAILYFAPRIFEMTGLGTKAALLQSIGIGFTNLIFTFVGLWLIDRIGRKKLLIIGSFGYITLPRPLRMGFRHRELRHRPLHHLLLHRLPRHRPGRSHLGLHLRDLPRPPPRRRPIPRHLHPLGSSRPHHPHLPHRRRRLRPRLHLRLLRPHDGLPTHLGSHPSPGNQRRPPRKSLQIPRKPQTLAFPRTASFSSPQSTQQSFHSSQPQ